MKIKRSVNLDVQWPTWFAMGVAHALYRVVAEQPLVVTSANDGKHIPRSKHFEGHAFDARVHHITRAQRVEIERRLREILDPLGFDIVGIGAPGHDSGSNAHTHVEHDPKPGEILVSVTD